jgi:RHS repeat-associated protein
MTRRDFRRWGWLLAAAPVAAAVFALSLTYLWGPAAVSTANPPPGSLPSFPNLIHAAPNGLTYEPVMSGAAGHDNELTFLASPLCKTCPEPVACAYTLLNRAEHVVMIDDFPVPATVPGSCCGAGKGTTAMSRLPMLDFRRIYRSNPTVDGSATPEQGTYANHFLAFADSVVRLDSAADRIVLWSPSTGTTEAYTASTGAAVSNPLRTAMVGAAGATAVFREPTGRTLTFEQTGYLEGGKVRYRLTSVVDRNNNAVTLAYQTPAFLNDPQVLNLATVTDARGRSISFNYQPPRLGAGRWTLTQLTPQQSDEVIGNSTTTIQFQYTPDGRLNFVRYPGNLWSQWTYSATLPVLTYQEARLPADEAVRTVTFVTGSPGVVQNVKRSDGTVCYTRTDAAGPNNTVVTTITSNGETYEVTSDSGGIKSARRRRDDLTWEDPTTFVTDADGRTNSLFDPLGNRTWSVTRSAASNLPLTRNWPDGTAETFAYDNFAGRTAYTNRRGVTDTFGRDARGNLITHVMAVGTPVQATESWAYNAQGQPTSHTDANGFVTGFRHTTGGDVQYIDHPASPGQPAGTDTFVYTAIGRIYSYTDAAGRTTTYRFDKVGRLILTTFNDGTFTKTTYGTFNSSHRRLQDQDRNGNTTDYTYGAAERVAAVTVTDFNTSQVLRTVSYGYDASSGRRISVNNDGDLQTLTYTYRGQVETETVAVSAATNLTTTYGFVRERLVKKTDPHARVTTFSDFDSDGRAGTISVELTPGGALITEKVEYDPQGNLTSTIRRDGNRDRRTYDARDRVSQVISGEAPDPNNAGQWLAALSVEANGYDGVGNRTSHTNGRGKVSTMTYTARNALRTSVDPLGNTATVDYYADGLKAKVTNANGHATSFIYDDQCCGANGVGRIRKIVNEDGTFVEFDYDGNGNTVSATDESGRVVTWLYDGLDRRIQTVLDPNGLALTTAVAYDPTPNASGSTMTVTSPAGQVVVTAYDGAGRVASITGDTPPSAYAYDAVVNDPDTNLAYVQTSVTDGVGDVSKTLADGAGRTVRTIDGRGKSEVRYFDGEGRPTAVIDRDGKQQRITYDAKGRIATVTDDAAPGGIARTRSFTYLPSDSVDTVTDAEGKVTKYGYDDAERCTSSTFAFGTAEQKALSVAYTPLGQPQVITKFSGRTITLAYDVRERLHTRTYSTGGSDIFEWHDNGLPKSAIRRGFYEPMGYLWGDITVESSDIDTDYDGANRNLRQGQRAGDVFRTWTPDGLLASVSMPSGVAGSVNSYTYTGRRELFQAMVDGVEVARHTYDNAGRTAALDRANGVSTSYGFDAADRLVSLAHGAVQSWQFGYTDAGDLTFRKDGSRSNAYVYDGLHRLTGDRKGAMDGNNQVPMPTFTQSWGLLPEGDHQTVVTNGTSATGTFGQHHQQTGRSDIPSAFVHDADLNLTDDGRFKYVYDINGQLTEVRDRTTNAVVAFYAYDALGRRVIVSDPSTGNGLWYCSYDGPRIVEMYDGGNDWALTFTYGNYVDEPLTLTSNTDYLGVRTLWYHGDQVFSVAALTDSTGTAVERYDYTAYGLTTVYDGNWANPTTASRFRNPYAYTGREEDAVTGNYHFRARDYLPVLGRFAQRDPAGYVEGMDLYGYVSQAPTGAVDPMGLFGRRFLDAALLQWRRAKVSEVYEVLKSRCKEKTWFNGCPCEYGDCVKEAELIARTFVDKWFEMSYPGATRLPGERAFRQRVNGWLCYEWTIIMYSALQGLKLNCWDVFWVGVQKNDPLKPGDELGADHMFVLVIPKSDALKDGPYVPGGFFKEEKRNDPRSFDKDGVYLDGHTDQRGNPPEVIRPEDDKNRESPYHSRWRWFFYTPENGEMSLWYWYPGFNFWGDAKVGKGNRQFEFYKNLPKYLKEVEDFLSPRFSRWWKLPPSEPLK